MSEAADRAEYEQYLRETGQSAPEATAPKAPFDPRAYLNETYTPEAMTAGANNAAAMMSGGLTKAIPALGRGVAKFAAPFLEGGISGAAQSPDDRLSGMLKGGLTQGALSTAAKVAAPVGDRAMQFAVGRK